jgi:hypothetical protein
MINLVSDRLKMSARRTDLDPRIENPAPRRRGLNTPPGVKPG